VFSAGSVPRVYLEEQRDKQSVLTVLTAEIVEWKWSRIRALKQTVRDSPTLRQSLSEMWEAEESPFLYTVAVATPSFL
jgi:hypothetical protein